MKVSFIGDDGNLTKTIGEITGDLKKFEKALESATDTKQIAHLNKEIRSTKTALAEIKGFGFDSKKIDVATTSLLKNQKASNASSQALLNLGRVAQDAPFGFIGIANNLNPLLESFGQLRRESGSAGSALKTLAGSLIGVGGLGLALSAFQFVALGGVEAVKKMFGAVDVAKQKADKLRDAVKAAKEETENFIATLNESRKIQLESSQNSVKEIANLELLYKASQNQNLALGERKKAVDALQEQYPKYFGNIKDEIILAGGATAAYNKLKSAIVASSRARVLIGKQDELTKESFTIDEQIADAQRAVQAQEKAVANERIQANKRLSRKSKGLISLAIRDSEIKGAEAKLAKARANLQALELQAFRNAESIDALATSITTLQKTDGLDAFVGDVNDDPVTKKIDKRMQAALAADEAFRKSAKAIRTYFMTPIAREEVVVPLTTGVTAATGANPEIAKAVQLTRDQFEAEAIRKFAEAGIQLPKIDFGNIIDFKAANDKMDAYIRKVQDTAAKISGVLTPAFQSMFNAIIEGEDPIKSFFRSIGQSITQLISQLIAAAIQAAVLKAISFGGGGATFGIGKAIGSMLGSSLSGGAGGVGLGGAGGIGFGGDFRGGGLNVALDGNFTVRGSDLILALGRANQSQGRNG